MKSLGKVGGDLLRATAITESPIESIHDRVRDEYFASQNIRTLRFSGGEIHRNVDFCIEQITQALHMQMRGS